MTSSASLLVYDQKLKEPAFPLGLPVSVCFKKKNITRVGTITFDSRYGYEFTDAKTNVTRQIHVCDPLLVTLKNGSLWSVYE
jgi:hypothetical protein